MKAFIFISLILLSAALMDAPRGEAGNDEAQLLTTLRQMYDAEKRHDRSFIRSHLSDDFKEVAGDGRVYEWKDIEPKIDDMELREYKLNKCISDFIRPDVAYLSCEMEADASFRGNALPHLFRVTWIWTRGKDRRWMVRFEQATIIPEATVVPHN